MIDGCAFYAGDNMFHENVGMQLIYSKPFTSVFHVILKEHFGVNFEAVQQFNCINDSYQKYIPQLSAIIQNTIKCFSDLVRIFSL